MILSNYLKQLRGGNYLDIIWCTLRYGASPNNYYEFNFANLTAEQRQTFVTNRLSRKMIKRFNNPQYIDFFEDKIKFAQKFAPFFGRKWISTSGLTKKSFADFLDQAGNRIIYKPVGNAQGQGIKVFSVNENLDDVYAEVTATNDVAIIEQWISQHQMLSNVYADAINCLRIITVLKNDRVHFLTGGVTWGNGMKIANASASGIVSPVDFATGILTKPAADFHGHSFDKHPMTGANLISIQLPYWNETLQMLEEAARIIPQVAYIGWDLAITPKGPILIEGNTTPGYKYYQIPAHLENHIGNRRIYEQVLNE